VKNFTVRVSWEFAQNPGEMVIRETRDLDKVGLRKGEIERGSGWDSLHLVFGVEQGHLLPLLESRVPP
jgi:hypothetical protein